MEDYNKNKQGATSGAAAFQGLGLTLRSRPPKTRKEVEFLEGTLLGSNFMFEPQVEPRVQEFDPRVRTLCSQTLGSNSVFKPWLNPRFKSSNPGFEREAQKFEPRSNLKFKEFKLELNLGFNLEFEPMVWKTKAWVRTLRSGVRTQTSELGPNPGVSVMG